MSACQDLPPDTAEQARKARAMDKMEADQVQSDIARAAEASASNKAAKSKAVDIPQEKQVREQ